MAASQMNELTNASTPSDAPSRFHLLRCVLCGCYAPLARRGRRRHGHEVPTCGAIRPSVISTSTTDRRACTCAYPGRARGVPVALQQSKITRIIRQVQQRNQPGVWVSPCRSAGAPRARMCERDGTEPTPRRRPRDTRARLAAHPHLALAS